MSSTISDDCWRRRKSSVLHYKRCRSHRLKILWIKHQTRLFRKLAVLTIRRRELTRSRDYSQAVDVGTLGKGIKLGTIRILVWVMGFMAHGYATEEFEV